MGKLLRFARNAWMLLFILALAISGCGGQTTAEVNSPVSSPSASNSAAAPSVTPTPFAATASLSAASNRTATAAFQETQLAQTSVASQQTYDAGFALTSTAVLQAIQATVTPRVFQSFASPDGKSLAEVIVYDCARILPSAEDAPSSYEILKMSGKVIDTQFLSCGGLGAAGFGGYYWTRDSRFFYYTNAREGWPDGGYPWRRPISRYDVTTGKSETLEAAAYSPDQQKIAGAQGADLVVWDLAGAAAARFPGLPPDQAYINWIAWSPDGRSLVYLTQTINQTVFPYPSILTRVDLDTQQQTHLLGPGDPGIIQVDWTQPGTLQLFSFGEPHRYTYDLASKRLTPVLENTPTPGPGPTAALPRDTETPVPTYPADPAFPASLYPPAAPFRQPVDRSGKDLQGHGCPSVSGLQAAAKPTTEAIQPVLEAARSGDVYQIRQNSDPAYWPVTGLSLRRQLAALGLSRIELQPAAQSPLATTLSRLCGNGVLRASWWANVKADDGVTDYFLIERQGRWLVWISVYDYAQWQSPQP